MVWPTWKAWIEEATEGRVTVDVVHDLGPPASQMEMVADGIADATWVFHGYNAGRFLTTSYPSFLPLKTSPRRTPLRLTGIRIRST